MHSILQRTGRSLREIYQEYLPMVYRIAFTYMKNSYDSEDAAQETFMRLLRCGKPFRDTEHVKAWLIVTVTNVCRDMLRRKQRTELNIEDFHTLAAEPAETDDTLMEAILALPDSYKTVIYMYYYEGYSTTETAKILGKSPNTIKTWLSRARAKLKEQLGEDFDA